MNMPTPPVATAYQRLRVAKVSTLSHAEDIQILLIVSHCSSDGDGSFRGCAFIMFSSSRAAAVPIFSSKNDTLHGPSMAVENAIPNARN